MGRGGGRVDKCYKLSNRRGCGGGWWTDRPPNFSFYSLNWESIQFCLFSRLIFVTGLILEVIVFLVSASGGGRNLQNWKMKLGARI